ncbi:MAG: hypothetical protein AB1553_04550 [Nitrospirota bacterium]
MSKPISFRISEEDFDALKERADGTISEFVKGLVLDCLHPCKQEGETCIQAPDCDNCKEYTEGFDAGFEDAKKEDKEEIERLFDQLRALEVERNCNNCQNVNNLQRQIDDISHEVINVPSCDSCSRVAGLERELQEERETIHVSADCERCDTKAELSRTLLNIAELQGQIEDLKAAASVSTTAPVSCDMCDKVSALTNERDTLRESLKEAEKALNEKRASGEKYDSLLAQYNALQARFREHREKYKLTDRAFLLLMAVLFAICLGLTLVATARLLLR